MNFMGALLIAIGTHGLGFGLTILLNAVAKSARSGHASDALQNQMQQGDLQDQMFQMQQRDFQNQMFQMQQDEFMRQSMDNCRSIMDGGTNFGIDMTNHDFLAGGNLFDNMGGMGGMGMF